MRRLRRWLLRVLCVNGLLPQPRELFFEIAARSRWWLVGVLPLPRAPAVHVSLPHRPGRPAARFVRATAGEDDCQR